jgi:hypothetical protein
MKENLDQKQYLKRLETVFKQCKGVFTELSRNPRIDKGPKQITYVIEESCSSADEFIGIRDCLASVFRTN